PRYVTHMEEPVCEPPAISLYFVSRLAREKGVKVLLSGEGGDEAFAGYPKYRNLMVLEQWKRRLGPARGLLNGGFKLLELARGQDNRDYRSGVSRAMPDYYYGLTATPESPFNRSKGTLYRKDFAMALNGAMSHQP